MIVGLLPELRGGLGTLARSGQHTRFIEGYLRAYARTFDEVRYFSYLREALIDFVPDAELVARVRVVSASPLHPWLYAAVMGLRHGQALAQCSVLRVFQLTGAVPAIVARQRFGVPFATTYGFRYDRSAALERRRGVRTLALGWMHRRLERLVLGRADAVIVTTPELGAHVAKHVRSPRAIHLLPNAVDTTLFRPTPRATTSSPTVLYVGRFSNQKNLFGLIEAVAKLRARLPVALRFVGDGPLRDALAAAAGRSGVPLELAPTMDHRRLPAVYAAADVFVLPSFIEGHPKVLLEAMSCGLPCVASNIGGNRAAVDDGRTGLLVDPTDAGALADAIERLVTDRELARRLGEAARREIVEHHELSAIVAREIELLQALANRRGPR
jgi:glycosyltransferase involved in cell wall biosynthesis